MLSGANEHAGVANMGKAGKGTGSFGESLGPGCSQTRAGAVWMPNVVQQAVEARRQQQPHLSQMVIQPQTDSLQRPLGCLMPFNTRPAAVR